MNTDKLTTWLGFLGSLLLFLQHQGIIDENLSTLLSAILTALFGYLTNKVRNRKEPPNRNGKTTNISGINIEV